MNPIPWAFLCSSARPNARGGVDVTHLHDKFALSDIPNLCLVAMLTPNAQEESGSQTFAIFSTFQFAAFLRDEFETE
jgi:hypothetical protein